MPKLSQETMNRIALSIKNGWPLRPVQGYGFQNINYQKGTKIDDPDHILTCMEDFKKFPKPNLITAVCLVSPLVTGFICIDLDFKEEELKSEIWAYIKKHYKEEELFLRVGNRDKLGQLWFHCVAPEHSGDKGLDIITTNKRCDAMGLYKGDEEIEYEWPYKSPWTHTPKDLPLIKIEVVNEIRERVAAFFGEDVTPGKTSLGRHDTQRQISMARIGKGENPFYVLEEMMDLPVYQEVLSERPDRAKQDLVRMIGGAFMKVALDGSYKRYLPPDSPYQDFTENYPKTENGSFLTLLTKATRRNQEKDSKKLAFFSSLAAVSWILTHSVRCGKVAPNLLILYIAKSGAGKSTSSRVINELVELEPRLRPSYAGGAINSSAAFAIGFETAPVRFYKFDEYSRLLKGKKGAGSHIAGITELMGEYYSDFPDNRLQAISLKYETYGVCYGPKLCALMFTTPSARADMDLQDFEGGFGRRLFTIVDSKTYRFKKKRPDEFEEGFFLDSEKEFIYNFIKNYVFDEESEATMEVYDTVNIAAHRIPKSTNAKTPEYYSEAKAPHVRFRMKYSEKASEYMGDAFTDLANRLIGDAVKSGDKLLELINNSIKEYIPKLAMIHSLAGKAKPSLTIEKDSVDWAVQLFLFYMSQDLREDVGQLYDTEKDVEFLFKESNVFIEKLKEKNVSTFNRSHVIFRSFFRGDRRKRREEILEYLVENEKLEVLNEDTSKRSITYKVL